MKKIISLTLALCLAFIANAVTVVSTAGGLNNAIANAGANIDTLTKLTISGTIDARDFVTIQNASTLKSLDLSNVTIVAYEGSEGPYSKWIYRYVEDMIPKNAFKSATLDTIILPNSKIDIGALAFEKIQGNPIIIFSESTFVTTTGSCQNLKGKIIVSSDNPYYTSLSNVLYSKDKTQLIRMSDTCITTFDIPIHVQQLADGAFFYNEQLKRVNFPSSLKTIGKSVFTWCSKLDSLYIPSSVTNIDEYAFNECSGLSFVNLEAQIDTLRSKTFSCCKSLKSINLPNSLKVIGSLAFELCVSLNKITLPDGLVKIEDAAFEKDSSLVEIKLPNTIKTLNDYCFGETGITYLTIPASTNYIGINLSAWATKLKTTKILTPINNLKEGIFSYCYSLKEVYLPSTLNSIESYSFSLDSNLTDIYLPVQKPIQIDTTVFGDVKKSSCTIYVPIGAKAAYTTADIWKDFKISEVDTLKTLNTTAGSLSSVLTNTEKHMTKKLVLSGSIDIRDIFFMRDSMPNLAAIDLQAVTIVGHTGLIDSTLFRVATTAPTFAANTLPKTAFKDKTVLTYISLPASLTSIQDYAFSGCPNLNTIVVNNASPIDLSNTTGVFDAVDKNACELIVPSGSETAFRAASIWQDFLNTTTNIKNNTSQESKLKVIVKNGKAIISGLAIGQTVTIYNLQGQVIFSKLTKTETLEVNLTTRGMYVLQVKNESIKVVY